MSDTEDKKEVTPPEDEVLEFEFNEDPEGKQASYGAGGEEELIKKLQKLKSELKVCQKEKEEYLTGWQKERAEFANYRKSEDDRKAMLKDLMQEKILSRFLAVMDNFNMAFANREAWEKVDENWRRGVEYIYGQMSSIFEEHGVQPIGAEGEAFDPSIYESVELVPTDKKELDHTVASVIQKGYQMGEKVLRPARVKVYEYKEPQK